jgi:hypothetical protein
MEKVEPVGTMVIESIVSVLTRDAYMVVVERVGRTSAEDLHN